MKNSGNLDVVVWFVMEIDNPFTLYTLEVLMLFRPCVKSFRIARAFDNRGFAHLMQC